jgi:hypothetical protein
MNNHIENASPDCIELKLEDLENVAGGGDTADAVAYVVGNVIGGLAYLAHEFGSKLGGKGK